MNPIKKTLVYIIYIFSCLIPRSKKIYVYIGWHKSNDGEVFADNTKYLYLYTNSNDPKSKHIWIGKSHKIVKILRENNLASYYQWSLPGIWSQLRARYFVLDAFLQPENFMFSGTSKIIQLLHGKGMKKRGYGEPQLKKQDYIFGTSQFVYDTLSDLFTKGSKYFIAGYSRNDVLFSKIPKSEISVDVKSREQIETAKKNGSKIVLYAPTFRRGKKTYDLKEELDLVELEKFSKEKNIIFVCNLHNKYRYHMGEIINKNIVLLPESDIYPLFPLFDLMVTDYSSIFVDYLLLDRPIIFYPYDFDEYSKKEGLVADYDSITPGPKVYTFSDLLEKINGALFSGDDANWAKERSRVRDLYHAHTDGKSSERIWDIIKNNIK